MNIAEWLYRVGRTYVDAAYPDPKFDLPAWRA